MEPFIQYHDTFYLIEDWTKKFPGLVAGFTTKHGGVSKEPYSSLNFGFHVDDELNKVCENRQIFAEQIGFPLEQWVGAEQTHETNIQQVSASDCGKGADSYDTAFISTDGFFSLEKNVLLTLCYADCVPLYFLVPNKQIIGIAHAGWKGTVNGIANEMVATLMHKGVNPMEIKVVIGPSICGNCYIVDQRVINSVEKLLEPVEKKPYNRSSGDLYQLNLQKLNEMILVKAGVLANNIQTTKLCTSCHHEMFFSHRKDNGQTGRMISFIGWKE